MESESDFDFWNRQESLKESKWTAVLKTSPWKASQSPAVSFAAEKAFKMNQHFSSSILKCWDKKGKERDLRGTVHFRIFQVGANSKDVRPFPARQGPDTSTSRPTLKYSSILNLISITHLHDEVLCFQAKILHCRPKGRRQSSRILFSPVLPWSSTGSAAHPFGTGGHYVLHHWFQSMENLGKHQIKHPLKRSMKLP